MGGLLTDNLPLFFSADGSGGTILQTAQRQRHTDYKFDIDFICIE